MLWTLFAYICLWVAFFCLVLMGLLYYSGRTESDWLRKWSRRFGETAAETEQVRGLLRRFAILFLAAGVLFILIATPTAEMSPEEVGRLTLAEVICAAIIFWQIKSIRDVVKSQPGSGTKTRRLR